MYNINFQLDNNHWNEVAKFAEFGRGIGVVNKNEFNSHKQVQNTNSDFSTY